VRSLGGRGLTLVEMLVAVALTVLVATCVYGTVAAAGRVRDRLEAADQRRETAANALRLLARDLRAAVYVSNEEDFAFVAEDNVEEGAAADSLQFATAANDPLVGQRPTSDLCQVQYFLDFSDKTPERGLVRRQLPFPIPDDDNLKEKLTDTMELAPGARELDILYFNAETGQWLDQWDTTAGRPDAVKLRLVIGDAEQPSEPSAPVGERREDVRVYSLLVQLASELTTATPAGGTGRPAAGAGAAPPTAGPSTGGAPAVPGLPTLPGAPSSGGLGTPGTPGRA